MAIEEELPENIQPVKPSKKLFFIGLSAGLLLGAGCGAGAFFMIPHGAPVEHVKEKTVVEEVKTTDSELVKVDHLTVPIIFKNRVLGNAVINFSLEVEGNKNKIAVIKSLPEIRDALLRYFTATPIGKPTSPTIIDYEKLKFALVSISNKTLDKPLIKKVLITEVSQFK